MGGQKQTESRLGRYQLRYLVAQGGMASVYLGQLPGPHGFEKWVALKVIHPHLARNRRFVQMFLDEARVAARINHPNVCSITDFGEDQRRKLPFQVMEYLHGETFAAVLKRARAKGAPMPPRLVARVVADAARGLHAAHELKKPSGELLGVVHRDISPQNIFVLYDGLSKVLDFGIAQLRERTGDTKSGELKGKLAYMAPEQFRNEEIDRRTDVWALGVVLWEATVGRQLFDTSNQAATVLAVLEAPLPKPSEQREGYPAELEPIILRALARESDDRYQTAGELASALERFLYGGDEPAGPEQVGEWMSRHFADRLAARAALLRSSALPIDVIPEIDLGSQDESPIAPGPVAPSSTPVKGEGARRRWPLVAAAVLLLLVVGLGVWALRGGDEGEGLPDAAVAQAGVIPGDGDGGSRLVGSQEGDALIDGGQLDSGPAGEGDAEGASDPEDAAPPRDAEARGARDPGRSRHRETGPPGRLNLMAIPPAEVYSGGRRLGRTPLFNVPLSPGRHRLTLQPVGGGRRKTVVVRVQSGQTVRKSVRLDGN